MENGSLDFVKQNIKMPGLEDSPLVSVEVERFVLSRGPANVAAVGVLQDAGHGLVRPVGEPSARLEGGLSPEQDLLTGPGSGGHTDQPRTPGQTTGRLGGGRANPAAVDDPGVPEDQVTGLGLNYNGLRVVLSIVNLHEVPAGEDSLHDCSLLSDLFLDLIGVAFWHQLQTSNILGHIQEGDHSLDAVTASLLKRILIHVEIETADRGG